MVGGAAARVIYLFVSTIAILCVSQNVSTGTASGATGIQELLIATQFQNGYPQRDKCMCMYVCMCMCVFTCVVAAVVGASVRKNFQIN